jgi:hypothetical protein
MEFHTTCRWAGIAINCLSLAGDIAGDRTPQASIIWKAKIRPMQAIDMKGEEP